MSEKAPNNSEHISGYDEYKEKIRAVRDIAAEAGIRTDNGGEHYMVDIKDDDGKIVKTRMIMGRENIPVLDENNNVLGAVPARFYIEAVQGDPDIGVKEILKKYLGKKAEKAEKNNK